MKIHTSASLNVLICACVMLVAFFMPWITPLGFSVSGYNLNALFGSPGTYPRLVPILAVSTIVVSFMGNNRVFGIISGGVPLLAVAYGLGVLLIQPKKQFGIFNPSDVLAMFIRQVGIGAWITILASILIIVFSMQKHHRK